MHGGQRHLSEWTVSKRKRAFDLLVVLLIAPIAILAIAVAAAASAIIFRAQPFFIQHRRGLGGELFSVIKIRSLPKDFSRSCGKHELGGVELHWFSKVLRASHIDELPQLYNVLRGQMSMVGPRPMIDEVLARLPEDVVVARLRARPGMTGMWQVSTMGNESLDLCPQLDEWYVAHGTSTVDALVMVWTVSTALRGARRQPIDLLERFAGRPGCECIDWPAIGAVPVVRPARIVVAEPAIVMDASTRMSADIPQAS